MKWRLPIDKLHMIGPLLTNFTMTTFSATGQILKRGK